MVRHTRIHGCRGALEPREARLGARRRGTARGHNGTQRRRGREDAGTMNVWTSTSGSRTLKLERNGGSRLRSVRRTKMRTTSEAVVLPKMRISGKRSQDHQEEQQAKAKNSDEEMDIGKIEDEEDDGYQPNTKQFPWDMEDEEFFDSRSGEILERELVQIARKEEMDFMEKFGVYEDATIEECFAETGRAPVARSGLM